jgi:hypothetical protein
MATNRTVFDDDLEYDQKNRRYKLKLKYIQDQLNEPGLETLFGEGGMGLIINRVSRRYYDYIYKEKTYPEDFFKKEYLLITNENLVEVTKEFMLRDMESIIQSRRDMVALDHGVDMDNHKVVEDFDKWLENHRFAPETLEILNRNRYTRYKERLNLLVVENIREGY